MSRMVVASARPELTPKCRSLPKLVTRMRKRKRGSYLRSEQLLAADKEARRRQVSRADIIDTSRAADGRLRGEVSLGYVRLVELPADPRTLLCRDPSDIPAP
jgi:hypothetical protein